MHFSVQLLVIFCSVSYLVANGVRFRNVRSFDNLFCLVSPYWGLGVTPSSLHCAALCEKQAGCFSFFYNQENGTCFGVGDVNSSTTCSNSSGYSFYTMDVYMLYGAPCDVTDCNATENNLQCSEGFCKCTDYYNLIPDKRVCVETCDKYGDTFEEYPDKYMLYNDLAIHQSYISFKACLDKCKGEGRCRSFEYISYYRKPCRISTRTFLQDAWSIVEQIGAVYFQRNCL